MITSLMLDDNFNNIIESAVDEYCDAEDSLDDLADSEAEMVSVDDFIDDELDEAITQEDIDIVNDELLDDYETELTELDSDNGDIDYAYDDALENPFKDKVTVGDYLDDF